MANLPLAFAEILAGGVLLTAGITGDSIGNVMRGQITRKPVAGGSYSAGQDPAGSAASSSAGAGAAPTINTAAYGALKGAGGVTPTTFAHALLSAIGAPLTAANVKSVVDWEAQEGGNWKNTAQYNPLNTTQAEPGYSETGTQGNIGSYTSWAQGLQATVTTLESGSYNDILKALHSGKGLGGQPLAGLHDWSAGPNAAANKGYWSVN